MFETFTSGQKYVLYEAMLHAIRTDFRIGFMNQDRDHPVYHLGADGETMARKDGPEHNVIYQVMHEISKCELVDEGKTLTINDPVYCWQDFCRLVLASNKANQKPQKSAGD